MSHPTVPSVRRRPTSWLVAVVTVLMGAVLVGTAASPASAAPLAVTGPTTLVWSQSGTFQAKIPTLRDQPRATGTVTFSATGIADVVVPVGGSGAAAWRTTTLPVGSLEVAAA